MSWNEPGNDKNDKNDKDKKDPWSTGQSNNPQKRPPDLDEALRQLHKKLTNMLSQKKGSGGWHEDQGGQQGRRSGMFASFGLLAAAVAIIYILSGIYIVKPAERAVVFLFGRYVDTVDAGPHWIAPFIQSKQVVNVDQVLNSEHGGQMLTRDENIVSVELTVQFKIADVKDYLFNVNNPAYTLQQATDSAVRQVIGSSTLDEVLTSGRELIRDQIKQGIEDILSRYQAGLYVSDVAMQPAKAPDAVKESFDDAIRAQEDEQRMINQALAYEKQTVPIAEGQAQRRLSEAQAYGEQVVLAAQGDAYRFLQLLPAYQRNPNVIRDRLYLETMQAVLSSTSKILVDEKMSNSLIYLPLDKWFNSTPTPLMDVQTNNSSSSSTTSTADQRVNMGAATKTMNDPRDRHQFDRGNAMR